MTRAKSTKKKSNDSPKTQRNASHGDIVDVRAHARAAHSTPAEYGNSHLHYSHTQSHCGVEALEILIRLLEGVQGRRLQFTAGRLPLLVVLLAVLLPRTRACTICGHLKIAHLCHALPIHAHLREEILADRPPLGAFDPVDFLAAAVQIVDQKLERLLRRYLEVAEITILDSLAILKVDASVCVC